MTVIRFARNRTSKHPFFHIVVADSRRAAMGRRIETLGFYDPKTKELRLDLLQFEYWCGKGAKPSLALIGVLRRAARANAPSSSIDNSNN
jgi:small subunit ribosomal protein S16